MMKHPYLINLNDPEDVIAHYIDCDRDAGFVKERMDLLVENLDYDNTHELTRSVFYPTNVMENHVAKRGCETMIVLGGEIELVSRGRRCHVTKGDIMHFGAFSSHRMHWLKETPWIGYFNKMNITRPAKDKDLLSRNCPEMTDEELADIFGESYDLYYLAEPVAVDTPKSEIETVRTPDFAFATFDIGGAILRQKVGRWETEGEFELWDVHMEPGFYASSPKPCPRPCIFYVTEGNVKFKVFNEEFEAPADSIVHLPPYAVFSFEALKKSKMYDYSIGCMLYDYLSEIKSYRVNNPEKLKDEAFVKALQKKWGCYITEYGMK